ncbi:polysaccharide export protein EpsE [Janthinobacterium lividum]|uniref:Polysaccharide export protein EpsE n=1 Tax=Janthinobacterium lividum TaxID=29581 RepID=A0ABU0XVV4_9BURK|nr:MULTISPECIES: polysaccharide export protein EpsE [Janthinobacterium]MBR7635827.1 polysaccharide export protein EpsE [Janthinobacterium lividum]MCC7698849.1 polysaccharide export protein EpsE [Janthinobacterium sp. EB271-G4-7A]MCC7714377.1 polysaccharide export protein EpsE [Janthinobacterium lividum]MDQ4627689.1 polysaccharide export protein EpsE [Janthinobacterium lividum]MDQ4676507.1 polysaccharide export protein EpsE [Janthinobacterium lividum]
MKRLVMWCLTLLLAIGTGVASAADVQLGAGDVLKISVYGSPDLALETRISEAGQITFPLVGNVALGGLSVSAAEKKLGGLLESGGFLRKAQVNIIVTSLQSQQVSVLGQVNRPGRYPIEGRRSVMDMLAMAGGVSADGGDSINLIRKRDGKTSREVIDIVEMVRSADLNRDLDVAGNDVIFVERAPRFYIYGEVQRPGPFRLERSMTVLQGLSAGGGLTQRGTERGIRIKRRDAEGKLQILEAKHDDMLQVDDVVYVKESLF